MAVRAVLLCALVLILVPVEARATGYVVQPGDTLTSIAQRHRVTVASLAQANGIRNPNLIQAGRVLVIPSGVGATSIATSGSQYYRVKWGDTLIGIGMRLGLSVATLRALNPTLGTYLLAGQWLRICSTCQPAASVLTPAVTQAAVYVVRAGDSLSAIAGRFGVTQVALLQVNRLVNPNLVRIGVRLAIPSRVSVPTRSAAAVYDPWTARALIATHADAYGVSRALAFAVAWEESGFNQTLISSTGAIGVMQVEPYTGREIGRLLGRPFNLYDPHDNIQAGTYWLSRLLAYYGGDARMAVAAYYQGTASIARHGFYTDTTQYVTNVMALMARFGG